MNYPSNDLLVAKITQIRHEYLSKIPKDRKPRIWSSISENKDYSTITIVIPSRGCSWALSEYGGCSVCGYVNDSSRNNEIPQKQILLHLDKLLKERVYSRKVEVQIFNSGSFFDEKDVPKELRVEIINVINSIPEIFKLAVECRAEYIISEKNIIEETQKYLGKKILEIGIGLESSNDTILKDCWNKGTTFDKYKEAVNILQEIGVNIKSYVFLKPPFLTERESIRDTLLTIHEVIKIGTNVISINPCNIQNGTLVDELFWKGKYPI